MSAIVVPLGGGVTFKATAVDVNDAPIPGGELGEKLRRLLPRVVNLAYQATATLLLALLFSFLVLVDRQRLLRV